MRAPHPLRIREARQQYMRWLRVTRNLSPHTIRAYNGDVAVLERHLGGDAAIAELDRARIVGFLEELQAAGLSEASIRRRASGVRGFCRWLLAAGELTADPWTETRVRGGRSRKLPRTLSPHQLDRLLDFLARAAEVDRRHRVAGVLDRPHEATTLLTVSLMVATGIRVEEAMGIRCRNIDLGSRSLKLTGKGRRERQVFLTNDWITDLTKSYLATRAARDLQHPQLFFNLRDEPLTPPAMRVRLAKAARAAGLPAPVTPHMLRHTAATQLIEAGVDIRYIQRLLGHASLTTTEIYTHVSDSALKRVVSDADVLGRTMKPR